MCANEATFALDLSSVSAPCPSLPPLTASTLNSMLSARWPRIATAPAAQVSLGTALAPSDNPKARPSRRAFLCAAGRLKQQQFRP